MSMSQSAGIKLITRGKNVITKLIISSKSRVQRHSPDTTTGRRRRRRQEGQGSEQDGTSAGHLLRPISNCRRHSRATALFFHRRELYCSSGALLPLLSSTLLPKLPETVLLVQSSPEALLQLSCCSSAVLRHLFRNLFATR